MRYQKQPCRLRVIQSLAEKRVAETRVAEMKPAETRLVKANVVKVEPTKTKVVKTGLNLLLTRMANLVKPVTLWLKLVDANTIRKKLFLKKLEYQKPVVIHGLSVPCGRAVLRLVNRHILSYII